MMSKTVAISLCDMGLSYALKSGLFRTERFWPLRNISFDVYKGETLGVIGRNGVGKSTLLRLMAEIVAPCEGIVDLHGNRAALLALQAGFVPQLSGRQNIMIGGMLFGMRRREIEQRLDSIISFSDLGSLIDRPLQTYSAGMRARLGFSVAIQTQPDILLIDEALGVGDEAFREKSTHAMKELIQSDKTVVLVSHGLPVMNELCDRIIWIESGKIQMIGENMEVITKYVEFVKASAVGRMDSE